MDRYACRICGKEEEEEEEESKQSNIFEFGLPLTIFWKILHLRENPRCALENPASNPRKNLQLKNAEYTHVRVLCIHALLCTDLYLDTFYCNVDLQQTTTVSLIFARPLHLLLLAANPTCPCGLDAAAHCFNVTKIFSLRFHEMLLLLLLCNVSKYKTTATHRKWPDVRDRGRPCNFAVCPPREDETSISRCCCRLLL